MSNKEKLETLVESIKNQYGFTQEQISLMAGYKEQTLTQLLSSGKISARFLSSIEKINKEEFSSVVNEPNIPLEKVIKHTENKVYDLINKDQIIADLAHANRNLHNELKDIKTRLKTLEGKQFIASGDLEKLLAVSPTIDVILGGIGAVGAGKRWHSGEEGKSSLQIKIHENSKNPKKVKV